MFSLLAKCIGNAGQKERTRRNQHSSMPLRSLEKATDKFDQKRVIGQGSFGQVFKGELDGTKVAVKRRFPGASQGQREFQVEIGLLQGLKHCNLVSLFGYCDENNEMILVYDYEENETLRSHLYGSGKPSLSWKKRLEISVGAAKGLNYLHTISEQGIIHRDVKSENILLDDNLCAKVGDFGISRTGPESDQTHVTTVVRGTPGNIDPEYFRTQHLTKKSDVYSFGAVLLEVLCGRPPIDHERPEEEVSLVVWGMGMLKEGKLEQIVDQNISGTIKPRSLKIFCKIVADCLEEKRADRPSMEDVLRRLEVLLSVEVKNPLKRSVVAKRLVRDDLPGLSKSRVSPVKL